MTHSRLILRVFIGVVLTSVHVNSAVANQQNGSTPLMQRAIQYDRSLVTPPQAPAQQRHLLAVTLAASEMQVTNPAEIAAAFEELSSMVTYLVQSDTDFYWDGVGWTASSRSTYTWSGTKLIDLVFEVYEIDSGGWVNDAKTHNTYDGNGRLSTSTYQTWNGSWVNQTRSTFTYDGGGNMTYLLMETWTGSAWANSSDVTLTYNGLLVATQTTRQYFNDTWMNVSRIVYTYSGNKLTLEVWQAPTGPTWTDAERFTYTYDGSDRLTQKLGERFGASGPWTNWNKVEYGYDGSSTNEILEEHFDWDTAGETWSALWADTSRYSGNNRIELVSYWFPSVFNPFGTLSRTLFSYDGQDDLIEEIMQFGSFGSWSNSGRTIYIYIEAGVFDNDGAPGVPAAFSIGQNYPNPFNLSTLIPYTLDRDSQVRIAVSNILGQTVKTLVDSYQSAGRHQAAWDGRDQNGREVASGIYFFRVQVDESSMVKKMVLLK